MPQSVNGKDGEFHFKHCVIIPQATGLSAPDIKTLRKHINTVSDESIFHHTYEYFIKGHLYEYTNDFAQWAGTDLEEHALSERLSNLDPYRFESISDIRAELCRIIDTYLESFPEPRPVLPGDEFYFKETLNIVYPVGTKAKNFAEFFVALEHIEGASIYFHFYDARYRLRRGWDDFSTWFEEVLDKPELAGKIRSIDPFMFTVEGIRKQLVEILRDELRHEMEVY